MPESTLVYFVTQMRIVESTPPNGVKDRTAVFDGLMLSKRVYSPGLKIGWHSHKLAGLLFTLRGSSSEGFTNARFDHIEDGVILRPAGERHWDSYCDRGAKGFSIELTEDWLERDPRVRALFESLRFLRSGFLELLAHQVRREWLLGDTASQIAIPALVLEMAAHLIREGEGRTGAQPPPWLRRVKQRLDDGFADTPTLAELARIGEVHPTHVARHFRRHYRASVGEYLRRRRVDVAAAMLAQTDLSLAEIALANGFSDHGHFSTVFKRFTGLTPNEFRRLRR
jgi:AraC family transcriptional regulator